MGQNSRGQSDCRIFKSTISRKIDEKSDFLNVDTSLLKLKLE